MRHGETFASRDGVPYGDRELTAQILPSGISAIERLGKYLKEINTTVNYTSELPRCVQTSQIVSRITGKTFTNYPMLNELFEDSFEKFNSRMEQLVEKLESYQGQIYLLCTHGAVISALKYLLTTGNYAIHNLMDYPNTGMLMIIKNGKVELLDFNN